jgi:hypothetical protein
MANAADAMLKDKSMARPVAMVVRAVVIECLLLSQ